MPHERNAQPWAGATYNGFSGPQAVPPRAPPAGRSSLSKKTLLGGLAAAVAGGLLFGLWVRPDSGDERAARTPMKAAPAAEMATAQPPAEVMPVEVLPPVVSPPPTADGPLEVLPRDLARAAEAARPVAPPAARTPPPAQVARAAPGAPAAAVVRAPPPAREAVIPPRPAPQMASLDTEARPSFNCRYARSPAERMICGDSELARLDRRLNRSFEQAVGSGIPYRELRAEQDDWLNIREDAARRSPDAVASVYRQRIRELNQLAEGY